MSREAVAYIKSLITCPNGERLTLPERLIAFLVGDYYQDAGGSFPSLETLASDGGTTKRHCQKLLTAIEQKGLIIKEHPQSQGRGTRTVFRFPGFDKQRASNETPLPTKDARADILSDQKGVQKDVQKGVQKGVQNAVVLNEELVTGNWEQSGWTAHARESSFNSMVIAHPGRNNHLGITLNPKLIKSAQAAVEWEMTQGRTETEAHTFILKRTQALADVVDERQWHRGIKAIVRFFAEQEYRLEPGQLIQRWAALPASVSAETIEKRRKAKIKRARQKAARVEHEKELLERYGTTHLSY
jgi:hypothetical protein